jgi:hypothetical protein
MKAQDEIQSIDKGWRILMLIWYAMLLSLVIYLQVGQVLKKEIDVIVDEDFPMTLARLIIYGVSAMSFSVTGYFRRYVVESDRGKEKSVPKTTRNQHPFLARYSIAVITSLALSESIGIYGLVLYLLGGNAKDLYILLAISAVAMYLYRPSRDEFDAMLQEYDRKMQPDKAL